MTRHHTAEELRNMPKVYWTIDREERIERALSILGPARPRFDRDDMRAAYDEIRRLRGLIANASEGR